MGSAWFEEAVVEGWSDALPRHRDALLLGGTLRTEPEDFVVEELPLYEPAGEGPHIYLEVTKRDATTPHVAGIVGRAFGVGHREVGYAGMKDRRAVTTQRMSVNGEVATCEETAAIEEIAAHPEVLSVRVLGRHRTKLKTGHLVGNRFELVVRALDAIPSSSQLARLCDELGRVGFANFFGPQRFGNARDNVSQGLAVLRGESRLRGRRRRLLVSAVQSAIFNVVVGLRVGTGDAGCPQVMAGDVLSLGVASGGCFLCEDVATERLRAAAREVWLTGPLPGSRVLAATGLPGALERAVSRVVGVEATPLSPEESAALSAWIGREFEPAGPGLVRCAGKLARGARRAMMVRPQELRARVEQAESASGELEMAPGVGPESILLRLSFELPRGCYATSLVREFTGSARDR